MQLSPQQEEDIRVQIAELIEAIGMGVRRIRFDSGGTRREQEYNSFDEMRRQLEWLQSLLPENATKKRQRFTLAQFERGV